MEMENANMEFLDVLAMDENGQVSFQNSGPSGDVASRLLTNGMSTKALRTNATLLYDEWKRIDTTVIKVAEDRLNGIADLRSRGLIYPISNGLGTTILQYEKQSGMNDASVSMDAVTRGQGDRPVFTPAYLPLPIIHKEFHLTVRALAASRTRGEPLDVTSASLAARKVAEKLEEILFKGASTFAYGGGTLYGYEDYPDVCTSDISNWSDLEDSSTVAGTDIITQVNDAILTLHNAHFYGPFVLYVPTAYDIVLNNDYKANSDRTIRERLLAIPSIQDIKVSDYMSAGKALLVQMTPDVVQLVDALALAPVEWDAQGGLIKEFRVITIQVPWIKSDYNGNCGICLMS